MELYHLRCFIAAAESLDFAAAARRLRIDAPLAARRVRALEEELGVRLFFGTEAPLTLTEAGDVFYERSRRVLRDLESAGAAARRIHAGEAGRLALAFTEAAEFDLLPQFVAAFSAACPLAELRLLRMSSQEQARALLHRKVQVGLLNLPSEVAGFAFRVIRSEPLVFALPQSHALAAAAEPMRIQRAAGEAFVLLRRAANVNYYELLQQFFSHEAIRPRVAAEADSVESLLALVAGGAGVALLPRPLAAAAAGVAYRPLRSINAALRTVLAWNAEAETGLTRAFLQATEHLAEDWRAAGGSAAEP